MPAVQSLARIPVVPANLAVTGCVYGRIGLVSQQGYALLAERIESLRNLGPSHTQIGHEMCPAHDGDLYPMVFLGAAVLIRSMRLFKGFSDLIPSNFMAAAPLVRLQLDNLLRFHAAFLVQYPHRFVMDVLQGSQINKLRSQDGRRLTDAYLVDRLVAKDLDIKTIYQRGCSYVHLSDLHLLHAVQSSGDMRVAITISEDESEVPDDLRLDAVETMISVTQLILNHVQGWVCTKANPELVHKPLERVRGMIAQGDKLEARRWLESIARDHPDPDVVAEANQ